MEMHSNAFILCLYLRRRTNSRKVQTLVYLYILVYTQSKDKFLHETNKDADSTMMEGVGGG